MKKLAAISVLIAMSLVLVAQGAPEVEYIKITPDQGWSEIMVVLNTTIMNMEEREDLTLRSENASKWAMEARLERTLLIEGKIHLLFGGVQTPSKIMLGRNFTEYRDIP